MSRQMVILNQQNKGKVVHPSKQTERNNVSPQLSTKQSHLSNGSIQRLLAQRSGDDGSFDLDNDTAGRINRSRGSGQALDGTVQKQMTQSMGQDFSGVRVHTGSESHQLNEQLNAKAFTTGSDIFFREGAYNPQSSSGQELIAHELTHVVQQSSGAVGGGGGAMRVNAPGDRFEQEADAVSKSVTNSAAAPAVQRATPEEEQIASKGLQRATMDEQELPSAGGDGAMQEDELGVAQKQSMPEPEEEKVE